MKYDFIYNVFNNLGNKFVVVEIEYLFVNRVLRYIGSVFDCVN